MSGEAAAAVAVEGAGGWVWPLDLERYDRSPELTSAERAAIAGLGWDVRRARMYDRESPAWEVIDRLVRPLDDARSGLGWCPDTRYHRRCANDAIGLILRRCADERSSYWGWSTDDWLALVHGSAIEFKRRWPSWVDAMVRAYLVADAYLLGGFSDFHRLGPFNRVALAWRIFGRETITAVIGEVDAVMGSETGGAFTKPVDPLVGKAIEAWEVVRPDQPAMLDRKTNERVAFLFAYRAQRVGHEYVNQTIIPALCAKAGVPTADVRGNITSHRARSTIASQLYNAKEPMTLFELQAWLGHRDPGSTQHYAKITPNALTRAYQDAGYFERNVRTIEVLIDRETVTAGGAAGGEPWQHYDLGHGYCSYTFFEQCPHRMACARCDFYTPKDSSKAQLLEAKDNLQRMLIGIPLTEEERAAVGDGHAALDKLLVRLTDVPTPTGQTPRQISRVSTPVTLLPPRLARPNS